MSKAWLDTGSRRGLGRSIAETVANNDRLLTWLAVVAGVVICAVATLLR
ncbi:MAG: hypothetical protein JWL84_193 [Rhodospirillales bacterium]|jgi:hypothetical protein|nr:hypothetical protein [Rhodospirillales bacterium]